MMYDGPTLASIPSDTHWGFRSPDLGVLLSKDTAVSIHVHGSVKAVKVFDLGGGVAPTMELWMWSKEDAKVAVKLFGPSASGKRHLRWLSRVLT